MSTVGRYVIWEVLKIFLVTALVITALLTLMGGVRDGLRQGLSPLFIVQSLPYILPEILPLTIPGAFLFAVTMVFGRLSRGNEIIALKSLGVSPLAIVWPVLFLGVQLSLVIFWMYDFTAAYCRPRLREIVLESAEDMAYSLLRSSGTLSTPQMSILVRGVEDERLIEPVIHIHRGEEGQPMRIVAREASLRLNDDGTGMIVRCSEGEAEMGASQRFVFTEAFEYTVPMDAGKKNATDPGRPSSVPLAMIPGLIREHEQLLFEFHARLETHPPNSERERNAAKQNQRNLQMVLCRLKTELHRRLSASFACVCFAMIGIPVAVQMRNANILSALLVCMLPILIIYYPLLVMGENAAKSGSWPPYAVWLPDAVFASAGAWMFRGVVRY